MLLTGVPVAELKRINLDLEEHQGERGIVFFPDGKAAREYMAFKILAGFNLVAVPNSVIIPLPAPDEQPQDYLDGVGPRLAYLIEQVRSSLGEQAARELSEKLTTRPEDTESP